MQNKADLTLTVTQLGQHSESIVSNVYTDEKVEIIMKNGTRWYRWCLNDSVTHLHSSHPACATRAPLGVDQKILSIKGEPPVCSSLILAQVDKFF